MDLRNLKLTLHLLSLCQVLKIEYKYICPGNTTHECLCRLRTNKHRKGAERREQRNRNGESESGKTTATNYRHSAAGSYRTEAATSLRNKLQMRRHYKAMLMKLAGALWDCHPRSGEHSHRGPLFDCTSESAGRGVGGGEG